MVDKQKGLMGGICDENRNKGSADFNSWFTLTKFLN
jgi:hypothetical protein